MDPVSIGATLSSIKLLLDAFREWREGDGDVTVSMDKVRELTAAVLEAQHHALEAREAQYVLMRRNDELERELQSFNDLREDKESYEIVNVGGKGHTFTH